MTFSIFIITLRASNKHMYVRDMFCFTTVTLKPLPINKILSLLCHNILRSQKILKSVFSKYETCKVVTVD